MRIICCAVIQRPVDQRQQQQRPQHNDHQQAITIQIELYLNYRNTVQVKNAYGHCKFELKMLIKLFPFAGACRIEKVPRNGWIEYAADKIPVSHGEYVNSFTNVNYKCLDNHLIEGPTGNLCLRGQWTNEIPDCQPRCSTKAITGVSIAPTSCFLNDVEVRCSEPAQPGTIARINCRDRYERQSAAKQQIISCGDDGVWSPLPVGFIITCGHKCYVKNAHLVLLDYLGSVFANLWRRSAIGLGICRWRFRSINQ